MSLWRQVTFWAITILVFVLVLWLLHGVLLPFVAGMTLAYLLDPLANRLERAGANRVVAALLIVGVFVLIGFIGVLALILGFAFGGARVLAKKIFPNRVFDRPEDVEIIRLNLE